MLDELNKYPNDVDTSEILEIQEKVQSVANAEGDAKYMVFSQHFGVYPLPKEEIFQKG